MQNAKMVLNWTPSPDATGQQVQRSLSSSGPWSTIATISGTTNSFTDNSVDPTPFTTYHYRIVTLCNGSTSTSSSEDDVCKNCPTEGNTFIFGARNLDANTINVQWTSATNKWINNNYPPSPLLSTTKTVAVYPPPSNTSKLLFCAECGEDINLTWAPGEGGTPNGSPNSSNFSYMQQQQHIASYLPTPPSNLGGNANDNLGTVTRKMSTAGIGAPTAGRFLLGIGAANSSTFTPWAGQYVSANTNVTMPVGSTPSGSYWNFGNMPSNNGTAQGPFTQIRIDRRVFNFSSSTIGTNQKTALQAFGSGNNSYMSIVAYNDIASEMGSGHLKCEHYIYKLTRKSAWDTTDSVAFSMVGFSNVAYDGYSIYSGGITHQNKYLPYEYNEQPRCYLKMFTL